MSQISLRMVGTNLGKISSVSGWIGIIGVPVVLNLFFFFNTDGTKTEKFSQFIEYGISKSFLLFSWQILFMPNLQIFVLPHPYPHL